VRKKALCRKLRLLRGGNGSSITPAREKDVLIRDDGFLPKRMGAV
jgi:hypothetical protein